ncbi:MAG: signal peptide peptidase SppA [Deltaproteobacteria bacterium]|nr:MAG: signal peptide peptidase SppA [Deltaproteobacteria bacterium]
MKRMLKFALYILAIVGFFTLIGGFFSTDEITLGDRVGVVKISGFIGEADKAVEALEYFRSDPAVKAVVVRVVSPGGMVAPSQEIHDEVMRVASLKPVVASFGAVAASGGYYLSVPATSIVADPGTITGSIGVIMQFQEYEVLLDKLGFRSRTVKSGAYKDSGSPLREMTEDDRRVMQGVVDDLFDQFVVAVADGRGMEKEKVLELADGRIYSGRQALKAGLVDKLGSFYDAMNLAGTLGGLGDAPEVEYWKPKKGVLMPLLFGEDADAVSEAASTFTAYPAQYVLPGW